MVALEKFDLINNGVTHSMFKGECVFGVDSLNAKYSGLVIQDVDVIEIDEVKFVKLSDVDSSKAKETKKKK